MPRKIWNGPKEGELVESTASRLEVAVVNSWGGGDLYAKQEYLWDCGLDAYVYRGTFVGHGRKKKRVAF